MALTTLVVMFWRNPASHDESHRRLEQERALHALQHGNTDPGMFADVVVSVPLSPVVTTHITEDNGHREVPSAELLREFDGACKVYGVGVGPSYYLEAIMARHQCDVYAFDCTSDAEKMGPSMREHRISFRPWCIGSESSSGLVRNSHYTRGHDEKREYIFKRLNTVMEVLGHDHVSMIKFDIEGFEWQLFEEILQLPLNKLPRSIVFELHLEGTDPNYVPPAVVQGRKREAVRELFLKLWHKGFRVTSKILNPRSETVAEFAMLRI